MLTACTYHTDMSKKRENLMILNPSKWRVFSWALNMQRRQLNIKIGTQLIMPSGNAAKCLKIDGDEFTFQYFYDWSKVVLTRDAIIKMMPERVIQ